MIYRCKRAGITGDWRGIWSVSCGEREAIKWIAANTAIGSNRVAVLVTAGWWVLWVRDRGWELSDCISDYKAL